MEPTPKKRKPEAWSMIELNRIVMAARTMPEFVGAIPGRHWWPALILLILDLDISVEMAIRMPAAALNPATGRIACKHVLYQLHAKTLEALNALPKDRTMLLPWPKDSRKSSPPHMLYRDYKTVLYRAGLPFTNVNSFVRLQVTTRRIPNVLDRVQPILDFVCQNGKPQLIRAIDRRRSAAKKDQPARKAGSTTLRAGDRRRNSLPKNRPLPEARASQEDATGDSKATAGKFLLVPTAVSQSDNPDALLNVFRSKFRPVRMRQATAGTAQHYERTIELLYSFAGRELTCNELTDELVENFLSDCFERGVKAGTCNHYRADLLAFWRFAWKKRLTDDLPRDVPKLKVEQQLVDAWTTDELSRIIDAASQLDGNVCDIPAKVWWPAFVLTIYDTGLRFNALMLRKTSDLDFNTGWLSVDASDQKQRKGQALKLHEDTLRLVRTMQPADREFLFPWAFVCSHSIRDQYRNILQAAGLPHTSRDLFHKLRRTSATFLAAVTDENTASKHLGHSSVSVPRRYLDPRQMQTVAAADLISRPNVGRQERR